MGDISIKGRSPLLKGGRVGFATGEKVLGVPPKKIGGISRLTGETGGVKEVFPGMGITGGASRGIKKGTPIRKEYASLKKAHRLRTKLEAAKATRKNLEQSSAFKKKHIDPASKETKVKISKQIAPKSWRRAGKT